MGLLDEAIKYAKKSCYISFINDKYPQNKHQHQLKQHPPSTHSRPEPVPHVPSTAGSGSASLGRTPALFAPQPEVLEQLRLIKQKAVSFYKESEYEDAITCFTEIIDKAPSEPNEDTVKFLARVYRPLAECYSRLERYEEAIEQCDYELACYKKVSDTESVKFTLRKKDEYKQKLEKQIEERVQATHQQSSSFQAK